VLAEGYEVYLVTDDPVDIQSGHIKDMIRAGAVLLTLEQIIKELQHDSPHDEASDTLMKLVEEDGHDPFIGVESAHTNIFRLHRRINQDCVCSLKTRPSEASPGTWIARALNTLSTTPSKVTAAKTAEIRRMLRHYKNSERGCQVPPPATAGSVVLKPP
jgi:hypothetical protein